MRHRHIEGFHIGAAAAKNVVAGSETFSHCGCVKDFATGGKTTLVLSVGFATVSKRGLDQ